MYKAFEHTKMYKKKDTDEKITKKDIALALPLLLGIWFIGEGFKYLLCVGLVALYCAITGGLTSAVWLSGLILYALLKLSNMIINAFFGSGDSDDKKD